MQYAVVKNNQVICMVDNEPCLDDLATRGEACVPCDSTINIGYSYDGITFSPPVTAEPTTEELMTAIRSKRDYLLSASDRYMLSDYPTGDFTREEWITKTTAYRQALRDFPETCDTENPVYPTL